LALNRRSFLSSKVSGSRRSQAVCETAWMPDARLHAGEERIAEVLVAGQQLARETPRR
jgi:hypothetical protein